MFFEHHNLLFHFLSSIWKLTAKIVFAVIPKALSLLVLRMFSLFIFSTPGHICTTLRTTIRVYYLTINIRRILITLILMSTKRKNTMNQLGLRKLPLWIYSR